MSLQPRVSSAIYRVLLRALPGWVRRRVAVHMQEAFDARMSETSGVLRRMITSVREYGALLRIAATERVRMPCRAWMRREGSHDAHQRAPLPAMLLQELLQACRGLLRRRAVSTLAVLMSGLGIGASTAMFSVVNAVLLKPLPYEKPEQLAFVFPTIEEWKNDPVLSSRGWDTGYWSQYEIQQYFEHQQSFSAIGAYNSGSARV